MDDVERFWDLASQFEIGMLVTHDEGEMRARPLAVYLDRTGKQFRFLTRASAHKVTEAKTDNTVCITLADPAANLFLSISGEAEITQDPKLIDQLWNAAAAAWFESGPDNPDIAVLAIKPRHAEYWEGPPSTLTKVWQMAAGAFGKRHENANPNP